VEEYWVLLCTYVCVFNLRSCHLRLTLGCTALCSLILVCVSQHRWMNAIGQKKALPHSLAITRDKHTVIGTERRAQVRLTLGCTSLCSLMLVCLSQIHNTDEWMLLVRRKLPLNRWPSPEIHTIGQINDLRSGPHVQYLIWAMDRSHKTSAQPLVSLSLVPGNSLKFQPLLSGE
jgi:hypothetical protein